MAQAFPLDIPIAMPSLAHDSVPPSVAKSHSKTLPSKDSDADKLSYGQTSTSACDAQVEQQQPKTTPSGLESSQPSTPTSSVHHNGASLVPSWSYPVMNKWRVLAACVIYFGNGMNDSAPGALIPYIESYYHIGYGIVSLIWVTMAVGFILAAPCNDLLCGKLGRAKALMLSEALMTLGYALTAVAGSSTRLFGLMVASYLFLGYGYAINLALNNVFCSNLANSTVILGMAHGSYGIGGILGPVMATALVSNGVEWSYFYVIMIAIRVACFFFAGWAFWSYEKEGVSLTANAMQQLASGHTHESSKLKLLGRALGKRTTIFGALFIFAYQGAEVAESGWFISYLISYRHGNPAKVGYVTAGFWAGITVGRFTLTHAAPHVGERVFAFGLVVVVIAFQLLSWLIPNVIGDAVAVAIVGLLLGPVYPCASTVFSRLLPGNLQVISIGFITSAGSSGGAVVPLITGLIAQGSGTWVLHPICIAFFVMLLVCWASLPRLVKRKE